MKFRRLPPLHTLEAFVLAARSGSFQEAARVLNLTPSAVSHQIKALEGFLGVALFQRRPRQLLLTPAGASYRDLVERTLSRLRDGTDQLRGQHGRTRLSVTLGAFVAAEWVLPRLSDFTARHPQIELAIDTSTRERDLLHEEVDVALRFGHGRWPGITALRLIEVRAVPVVAPRLAPAEADFAALGRLPRIHSTLVPEGWSTWARAVGIELPPAPAEHGFDSYLTMLQAVEQGMGVGLGLRPLIDGRLARGRLVAPWWGVAPKASTYWLLHRPGEAGRPELRAFRDWITALLDDLVSGRTRFDETPTPE